MTTNHPTEPLSAEDWIAAKAFPAHREVMQHANQLIIQLWMESYAAQQTAPLTATIAVLVEALKDRDCTCGILVACSRCKALTNLPAAAQAHLDEVEKLKATTSQLNPLIAELKAENERLKVDLEKERKFRQNQTDVAGAQERDKKAYMKKSRELNEDVQKLLIENERLTKALAETVDEVKHVKSCLQRAYTETHENWINQVLTIIDKPKYAGDFVYPEEGLEGDHEFSY